MDPIAAATISATGEFRRESFLINMRSTHLLHKHYKPRPTSCPGTKAAKEVHCSMTQGTSRPEHS